MSIIMAKFVGSVPMYYWGWEIYEDSKKVNTITQCKIESAKHGRYKNEEVILMHKKMTNG